MQSLAYVPRPRDGSWGNPRCGLTEDEIKMARAMEYFPEYTAEHNNKRCPFSRYSLPWRKANGLMSCTGQQLRREEDKCMSAGGMYRHNWELSSECMGHMCLLALSDQIELTDGISREPPRFRERVGADWQSRGWSPLPNKYKRGYVGEDILVTTKAYLERAPDGHETGELGRGSNEPEEAGTKSSLESNGSAPARSGEGAESRRGETAPGHRRDANSKFGSSGQWYCEDRNPVCGAGTDGLNEPATKPGHNAERGTERGCEEMRHVTENRREPVRHPRGHDPPERSAAADGVTQPWRPRYTEGESPNAEERRAEKRQILPVEDRKRAIALILRKWEGKERPEVTVAKEEAERERWRYNSEDSASDDAGIAADQAVARAADQAAAGGGQKTETGPFPDETRYAMALPYFPFCSVDTNLERLICPACELARPWRRQNGLPDMGRTRRCGRARSWQGMRKHARNERNTPHQLLADYLDSLEARRPRGGNNGPSRDTRRPSGPGHGRGPEGRQSGPNNEFPSGVPLGRGFHGAGQYSIGRRGPRGKGGGARGDTEENAPGTRSTEANGRPEPNRVPGNGACGSRSATTDSNIDEGAGSGGEGDGQTRTVGGQEVLRGDYNIKPRDRIYRAERAPKVPPVRGQLKIGTDGTLHRNRTGPRHKRRGGRKRPTLLLLMAFLLIPVGVIGEMIESRSGGRETTVSRVASEGVAIGTGRKGLATELRTRRTGGWGLRVATTEWEPGVALARAAKERGPPRTKLNSDEFSEGLDPDPIALHTTATRAARPPLRGRHPPPVPCAGGARMREARISQPQAKVVQGRTARHPAQSAISYQKKRVTRTPKCGNGAAKVATPTERRNTQGKGRQPKSRTADLKRASTTKPPRHRTDRGPANVAPTILNHGDSYRHPTNTNMAKAEERSKSNGPASAAATGTKGDAPKTPHGKGKAKFVTPSNKTGEPGKDTPPEPTGTKRSREGEAVKEAETAEARAAEAARAAAEAEATADANMEEANGKGAAAAKTTGPPHDPLAALAAAKEATLNKMKEKKRKAQMAQTTLQFGTAALEGQPPHKENSGAGKESEWTGAASGRRLRQSRIVDAVVEYIEIDVKASPAKAPKTAVREGVMTTMKCVAGAELISIEDPTAKSIRNPGSVPNKWQDGMERYVGLKDGLDSMRPVRGGRDKHRLITFTITLRVSRDFDTEAALDSASIDLQDESTEMRVKKNKCVFEKDDLIAAMAYVQLGEKTITKVLNTAFKEAHIAAIEKKDCSAAIKSRLRKTDIKVTVEISYPPYGDFEQQRKGGPRARFRAHHKRAARISYDAKQEREIKALLPAVKPLLRAMGLGKHAFVRGIPEDEGAALTVQRFKEDCDVHTAQSECATVGAIPGIIALDIKVTLEFKPEGEEGISDYEDWSLRDLLMMQKHNGKDLFRALAMQEDGTVMAIVCRGDGRDEAMANVTGAPAAWAMFHLLLGHDATEESTQSFLDVCFSATHVTAATHFGEYDQHTGKVSIVDDFEGEEGVEGSEAQDALAEGLFDLAIFKKEAEVSKAAVPAGRYYDSDDENMSRASMTTEAWRGKIMGLQGGIRARRQARAKKPDGVGTPPESGDGEANATSPGSSSSQPPPPAQGASDAGAQEA